VNNKAIVIALEVQAPVTSLPAQSFADFQADKVYDAVILCNSLVYVDGQTQGATIDRIAGYNADLLAVTAAHQDRIAADLERNAYVPIMDDFAAIHAGWIDRHRPPGLPKGPPPPTGAQVHPYMMLLIMSPDGASATANSSGNRRLQACSHAS
jgi:hypothetical protein